MLRLESDFPKALAAPGIRPSTNFMLLVLASKVAFYCTM
jgi:hypothetical protein